VNIIISWQTKKVQMRCAQEILSCWLHPTNSNVSDLIVLFRNSFSTKWANLWKWSTMSVICPQSMFYKQLPHGMWHQYTLSWLTDRRTTHPEAETHMTCQHAVPHNDTIGSHFSLSLRTVIRPQNAINCSKHLPVSRIFMWPCRLGPSLAISEEKFEY